MTSSSFTTRVIRVDRVADNIRAYTLAREDTQPLPEFSAGAHIDLLLDNGMARQYSLCSAPEALDSYRIAVQLEPSGRGGSAYIHEHIEAGSALSINAPRNHFELNESADHYLLIAGGIGITPLMLMAARLKALGKPFTLHYLCRTPEQAAFQGELEQQFGDQVQFHFSYGDSSKRLDLDALFTGQKQATEVYTCGSEPLLQSILDTADKYPDIQVIFERFSAASNVGHAENAAFEIELARSGKTLSVAADQSILEVLRAEGFSVETMCEEGLCGSCEVDLLEGEADHRDSVLTDAEKQEQSALMVCCSRAASARLKLDL